jgi:hypothetical protein
MARKSPFTTAEYTAVAQHVRDNPNLIWLNPPAEFAGATTLPPAAAAFRQLIESNDPWTFAKTYAYNVSPVNDNAPFFFFTLKTSYVLRNILNGTGHGMDWRINLGIVVLGMLLIISLVAVLAFLILPLAFRKQTGALPKKAALFYFVAVGFGYILVEISLIQRFVLFLGHPTYALTVVVFLLLLSSGAGSVVARRWVSDSAGIRRTMALILILIMVYLVFLPRLLSAAVGMEFAVKLLISGALLAPLGFLMGMPFPTGLRLVGTVEWAWALNAAASVLGSVLAIVIAIHFGLLITLACAAGAYAVAALLSLTWEHSLRVP